MNQAQTTVDRERAYELHPRPEHLRWRGVAIIATAIGAVAVGAFAIGALTVRRLAIRRAVIESAEFKSLKIRDLTVTRLRAADVTVSGSLEMPEAKIQQSDQQPQRLLQ